MKFQLLNNLISNNPNYIDKIKQNYIDLLSELTLVEPISNNKFLEIIFP